MRSFFLDGRKDRITVGKGEITGNRIPNLWTLVQDRKSFNISSAVMRTIVIGVSCIVRTNLMRMMSRSVCNSDRDLGRTTNLLRWQGVVKGDYFLIPPLRAAVRRAARSSHDRKAKEAEKQ